MRKSAPHTIDTDQPLSSRASTQTPSLTLADRSVLEALVAFKILLVLLLVVMVHSQNYLSSCLALSEERLGPAPSVSAEKTSKLPSISPLLMLAKASLG
jgi:hypothetical protein